MNMWFDKRALTKAEDWCAEKSDTNTKMYSYRIDDRETQYEKMENKKTNDKFQKTNNKNHCGSQLNYYLQFVIITCDAANCHISICFGVVWMKEQTKKDGACE